jgi:hypothetical protein
MFCSFFPVEVEDLSALRSRFSVALSAEDRRAQLPTEPAIFGKLFGAKAAFRSCAFS